MTRCLLTTIVIASIFSSSLYAQFRNRVVYGDDNRVEASKYMTKSGAAFNKNMARPVAAMIEKKYFSRIWSDKYKTYSDKYLEVTGSTLGKEFQLCSAERFREQIAIANCTGFLVGTRVLVTAGHCIQSQSDCDENVWVFDYVLEKTKGNKFFAEKSKVYKCQRVIKTTILKRGESTPLGNATGTDYAVILLDRHVLDRPYLEINRHGISKDAKLAVIGHPSGIPMKIADVAVVRDNSKDAYFTTNLDTFGGNSGSPVFNIKTGLVEGILVRGEEDYVADRARACYKVNRCKYGECRGEDVTRITEILNN